MRRENLQQFSGSKCENFFTPSAVCKIALAYNYHINYGAKMEQNFETYELLSSTKINLSDLGGIFLSGDSEPEISPEVAMWRGVITQALMDAGSNSKKPEYRRIKAEAISWLSGISDDFYEVCRNADLCPIYVKKKAKEAISRGCVWRQSNIVKFAKKSAEKKTKNSEDNIIKLNFAAG